MNFFIRKTYFVCWVNFFSTNKKSSCEKPKDIYSSTGMNNGRPSRWFRWGFRFKAKPRSILFLRCLFIFSWLLFWIQKEFQFSDEYLLSGRKTFLSAFLIKLIPQTKLFIPFNCIFEWLRIVCAFNVCFSYGNFCKESKHLNSSFQKLEFFSLEKDCDVFKTI